MRIAMLSTPFVEVPPRGYGGTELIVAELVEGLRGLGHEVLLFTVGRNGGDRRALFRAPVWPPDPYHELHHAAWAIAELLATDEAIDLIHTHCPTSLPLSRFFDCPVLYTIHHSRADALTSYYALQERVRFVAVSARQRELLPELELRTEVVHHGLDPASFPLGRGGEAAVFLGRLSAEKRPHMAIDVARRAGVPLRLAGRPHSGDEGYFVREVRPRLAGEGIETLGEVGRERKVPLLAEARALLFPIDWEEPFGLVMVEAMLCGTPVLASPRGAVPEVVDEGITGWVCRSEGEMVARLRALDGFDRRRCREHAIARFGRERMVRDYLALYTRLVAGTVTGPRPLHEANGAGA